jgi:hypothetical protein
MSDKSIPERLFLKKGYRFLLLGEPPGYVALMGSLPEGVVLVREPQSNLNIVQGFVKNQVELETLLRTLQPYLTSTIPIWVCYPKGTSGIKTDINRDTIYRYMQTLSMTANTMISIDSTWSAMRVKLL